MVNFTLSGARSININIPELCSELQLNCLQTIWSFGSCLSDLLGEITAVFNLGWWCWVGESEVPGLQNQRRRLSWVTLVQAFLSHAVVSLASPWAHPDKGWSFPTAQTRPFQVLYPNPHELRGFPAWLLEEAIFPVSAVWVAVVQSLSCVQLFATPWTAARQASLSLIISQSLLLSMLVCTSCSFPSRGWFPYTNVPMGTQQILKGTLWRSQGFLFFSFLSFIGCAWSLSWYVGSSSMAWELLVAACGT